MEWELFGVIHYNRAKIEMLCKLGWIIVKYRRFGVHRVCSTVNHNSDMYLAVVVT